MEEQIVRITVDEVLEKVKKYQGNFNPEVLCIYFATNIGSLFDEQEIPYKRYYIGDFIDTDYYHEFIITNPDAEVYAFLIDPAYSRFVENGQTLTKFKEWLAKVLKKFKKR